MPAGKLKRAVRASPSSRPRWEATPASVLTMQRRCRGPGRSTDLTQSLSSVTKSRFCEALEVVVVAVVDVVVDDVVVDDDGDETTWRASFCGKRKSALDASPSRYPDPEPPATVQTCPVLRFTLRMQWLPVSATYLLVAGWEERESQSQLLSPSTFSHTPSSQDRGLCVKCKSVGTVKESLCEVAVSVSPERLAEVSSALLPFLPQLSLSLSLSSPPHAPPLLLLARRTIIVRKADQTTAEDRGTRVRIIEIQLVDPTVVADKDTPTRSHPVLGRFCKTDVVRIVDG